jgi:hypothetical protein
MRQLVFWLLLWVCGTPIFAAVNTELQPSTISLGESFHLIITLTETQRHEMPNLLPLESAFIINATEHSVSTSLINGQVNSRDQWIIELTPKSAGKLAVPSIQVGKQQSAPMAITVNKVWVPNNPASQLQLNAPHQAIELQVDTTTKSPYLQQQMLYTVKLLHREELMDAEYQPPQLDDALVIPLGGSRQYHDVQNGQDIVIEEQRYAFFPQKTGRQAVIGPSFQAIIYRGMPQRVRTVAKPIKLNVKQPPRLKPNTNWFPATAVSLTEHYNDPMNTELGEGGTLSRTITIKAWGQPAELIPELKFEKTPGLSIYPDKPTLKNNADQNTVIGKKTIEINYLINKSGRLVIPKLTLTWFNTATNQEETFTLPERVLLIKTNGASTTTTPAPTVTKYPRHVDNPTAPSESMPSSGYTITLPWLMAIFFAGAWLLTLSAFLLKRRVRTPSRITKRQIIKQLRRACEQHDAEQAKMALIAWGQVQWPNSAIHHLDDLVRRLNEPALCAEINNLSKQLYAKNQTQVWRTHTLWTLIRDYHSSTTPEKTDDLPPINPC